MWNGISATAENSSIRDGTSSFTFEQYLFPLNLNEDVLSEPVNVWNRAMALHIVTPRLEAIVLREIILDVFPALNEIQIRAS